MNLEKAQERMRSYRDNIKFITRALNQQKSLELEPAGRSNTVMLKTNSTVPRRLYSTLDLELEQNKYERAVNRVAEKAINQWGSRVEAVTHVTTREERESYLLDENYFSQTVADDKYLILKLKQ